MQVDIRPGAAAVIRVIYDLLSSSIRSVYRSIQPRSPDLPEQSILMPDRPD